MRLLVDLSIGLVVFELGFRLNFDGCAEPWLFATAIAESGCASARSTARSSTSTSGRCSPPPPRLSAPRRRRAVVMLVAHELRAEGQITERMLLFTAVNTVFAYVC